MICNEEEFPSTIWL